MADSETCKACRKTFMYFSSERGTDAEIYCSTCLAIRQGIKSRHSKPIEEDYPTYRRHRDPEYP